MKIYLSKNQALLVLIILIVTSGIAEATSFRDRLSSAKEAVSGYWSRKRYEWRGKEWDISGFEARLIDTNQEEGRFHIVKKIGSSSVDVIKAYKGITPHASFIDYRLNEIEKELKNPSRIRTYKPFLGIGFTLHIYTPEGALDFWVWWSKAVASGPNIKGYGGKLRGYNTVAANEATKSLIATLEKKGVRVQDMIESIKQDIARKIKEEELEIKESDERSAESFGQYIKEKYPDGTWLQQVEESQKQECQNAESL